MDGPRKRFIEWPDRFRVMFNAVRAIEPGFIAVRYGVRFAVNKLVAAFEADIHSSLPMRGRRYHLHPWRHQPRATVGTATREQYSTQRA
jgi:hypothetical protein